MRPVLAPESPPAPFADFAPPPGPRTDLRRRITAAKLRPEADCMAELVPAARLPTEITAAARATAMSLVTALRAKPRGFGVEALMQEYALSSQEGVALMCLAEALLRIPDSATRDALIRDKIAPGDWRAHLGGDRPLFVNAATWGLVVTGLLSEPSGRGLGAALTRLIARAGEPVIRKAVDLMMRLLGEQFVCGETIEQALANSRAMEDQGFRYSYDMLGEAAMTAADAQRYDAAYTQAIHAIGSAARGRNVYERAGISIKLSALHPRYARAQSARVLAELLPRLRALALLARQYDIGLNIDAEESERLELSLDLLEALALDETLASWEGLGFVVQAYGKRCPAAIDYLIDLAQRSGHRLMIRLVKGAYWDSEIKRAQVEGLADFPVYTRKTHTDVAYLACARKLLAARSQVFPQFATHNAQTLATIHAMADAAFSLGDYEFQCLHGMGEPLYAEVVGPDKLDRPCRIYAPVGTHETLLAYLVRRLLENGANTSFVNRIADPDVQIDDLIADPVMLAPGTPHPAIALPADLFGARRNSAGLDLTDEDRLSELSAALRDSAGIAWRAAPTGHDGAARAVLNPADHRDVVGHVVEATPEQAAQAVARATEAAPRWAAVPAAQRAAALARAADALQTQMPELIGLIIREAGKTAANAVGEVREAIDFLRYYGAEATRLLSQPHAPLGPVACISPWNFPLAIFTGQVAAALAAGNPVLAKPAEETPLIAARAVALLHAAGVPQDVLQLVPGDGKIGAALVGHAGVHGVMFTGSTEVARLINRQLAKRRLPDGQPIPLVAETGGQNAMIVDSSALPEQVVADVIASAFDSAGQRCSALRVLCLQEEVADRILTMLEGAMRELGVGRPDRLAIDVGPVITADARETIERHIAAMRRLHPVTQFALPQECRHGTFVTPTLIGITDIAELTTEVFGPVLHVLRYPREDLAALIDSINRTGYGLTFGLHTRLDDTVEDVLARIQAGNVYVNRNMIGAVVGTQPFGGHGLSGTGPKAGGPLYLPRLLARAPHDAAAGTATGALAALIDWLTVQARPEAARCRAMAARSRLGGVTELPGPVGERNTHEIHPRGRVRVVPASESGLLLQIGAALATGNRIALAPSTGAEALVAALPARVRAEIDIAAEDEVAATDVAAALVEENDAVVAELAARDGAVIPVQRLTTAALMREDYRLDLLVSERSVSVNTAASGGNASLMAIG